MLSRLLTCPRTYKVHRIKLDKTIKTTIVSTLYSDRSESNKKCQVTNFVTKDLLLPKILNEQKRLASAFSISKMVTQIGTNSKNILIGVDFNELHRAPPAAFWITTSGGLFFITIPLLEMIFGYSSFLTTVEMGIGVAFLSMLGSMKWGHCLERAGNDGPTWHNLTWSMVPPGVAVFSYMLPESIGLLVLSGGICHAVYMDVSQYTYPPWANALGCYISTIAVVSLSLSAIGHIVFS